MDCDVLRHPADINPDLSTLPDTDLAFSNDKNINHWESRARNTGDWWLFDPYFIIEPFEDLISRPHKKSND